MFLSAAFLFADAWAGIPVTMSFLTDGTDMEVLIALNKKTPKSSLRTRACLKNKNCTNQMLHFPFS